MKYATLLVSLLLMSCATGTMIQVPPSQSIEISYPETAVYDLNLKNKSSVDLGMKMRDFASGTSEGSFGFPGGGKTTVSMQSGSILRIENRSDREAQVRVSFEPKPESSGQADDREFITFTLRNKTAKSIPLIIPGVMNPNLSPFSNSGVSLAIGQEILFKERGKKYILLTVDRSIADGEKIDVAGLISDRREALGLK